MNAFSDLWKFLQDVWREVRPRTGRVTWPAVKNIKISTVVVMISSIILGFYILFCDAFLRHFFSFILGMH